MYSLTTNMRSAREYNGRMTERKPGVIMDGISGKTIIITGGTLGIGEAAARRLRQAGARVAITGRSEGSRDLARRLGCDFFRADYASLSDVRNLADALLTAYPRIDILANNVGGVMDRRTVTRDGHERTFQVNHLGGFLLTHLLRQRLEASQAVVINTASRAHTMGHIDMDDLENAQSYEAFRAYGTAKLMNILHADEINRRFDGVNAVSFHPGVVATGFGRAGSPMVRFVYDNPLTGLFMLSPDKGADTLVWLATSGPGAKDGWTPGQYYAKRRLARKNAQARDPLLAARLWDASVAMIEK